VNTNTLRTRPATATWFNTASRPDQRRHLVSRLFVDHHAAVIAFAQHLGAQSADAEDVCSIVFEIAFRRLDSFRGDSSPRTWLLGIARRVLADRRRCASARREQLVDRSPDHEQLDTPETDLLATEERELVASCVRALPAPQRQVVTDFVLHERPMAETATRANVPLQTAYARLYAGQRQLATTLRAIA
jgi:RNA polymerase sigma-70 factor (ECF subfamily)